MSVSAKPFNAWYIPDPPCTDSIDGERFVYVGCVHETTDDLVGRLNALAHDPPNYLIFGGDVTGSHELETFKRLFYNHVYNRVRGELGIGTPQAVPITDTELLAYIGRTPPTPGHTLKDGYEDLMSYAYFLEGNLLLEEARELTKLLTDSEIANGIRHLASAFIYFGPWVKTLPHAVRESVVRTLKADAEKLLAAIQPVQENGAKIIMVGGNWDNAQNTRDNMAGDDIDVFDTIPFFRQHGIEFYDHIGHLTTDKSVHIFLPYWELTRGLAQNENEPAHERLNQAMAQAIYAYRAGKTVIVVAHAEPSWQAHNVLSTTEPTGDRKLSIGMLGTCLAMLQPDEVIYPHQHDHLRDSEGCELWANTKYILRPCADGVALVTDINAFSTDHNIISTYVPYQCLATLTIPTTVNPRPKLFGGCREPAYVH